MAGRPAAYEAVPHLHVPFCAPCCGIGLPHHITGATSRSPTISAYCARIGLVSTRTPARLAVEKVHFGGGTPTIIKPEEFIALADLLRERFEFTPSAEMAVEIDPRTLSAGMAAALAQAGVARASLGVQSFDPAVQRAINRIQSEECTAETVHHLRHFGVERINFDLIYGLPNQPCALRRVGRRRRRHAADRFAVSATPCAQLKNPALIDTARREAPTQRAGQR